VCIVACFAAPYRAICLGVGTGPVEVERSNRLLSVRLAFGVDTAGHLVAVPSATRRELTTLGFLPDGLTVSTPSCAPVTLGWDSYGQVATGLEYPPLPARHDGWGLAEWFSYRGLYGVRIQVSGRFEDATSGIYSATSSLWRRLNAGLGSDYLGRPLPVVTKNQTRFDDVGKERCLLEALCEVLHDMPELRQRLDDSHRVRRLAGDIDARRPKILFGRFDISGDAVDIHVALVRLGYTYPYTRPLTASLLPTVAEVTDQVVAVLAGNPYRSARTVDREQVERIVRRDFIDVEPWPFGALVDA